MERMKYYLAAELVPKDGPGSRVQEIEWGLEAEFLPKSTAQERNLAHEKTALEQKSSVKLCLENREQTQWKVMH